MNKQPFYHVTFWEGRDYDPNDILKTIRNTKRLVKDSIEKFDHEILFTCTDDMSEDVDSRLHNRGFDVETDCEPGDPADLM